MTLNEAAKLLELPIDATPAQVDANLKRLSERLQAKIDADAGESYKKKNREALARLVAAAELFKLSVEVNSAPRAARAPAPDKVGTPLPPARDIEPAASPRPAPAPSPAAVPAPTPTKSGNSGRALAIAAVLLLVGGGGAALALKNRAAPDSDAAGQPADVSAPSPVNLAELRTRWTVLESELASSENLRAEIERDLLARGDRPAPALAALRARARAQDDFLAWYRPFLTALPVRGLLERLDGTAGSPAAPASEAPRLAGELRAQLDLAEAELAARKPALLALGRPLDIASEPAGLRYTFTDAHGGIHEGTTPAKLEAPWGAGRVVVVAPSTDWTDWERELVVERDRAPEVKAVFAHAPLRLSSDPAGLAYELILANGVVRRGLTPEDLEKIPAGPATVRVSRPGWADIEAAIKIEPGQSNACVLEFVPGSLSLGSTPPGATVTRDGRELGVTPLTLAELPPGSHAYELTLKGHVPTRLTAEIRPRDTTLASVNLLPSSELVKGQSHVVPELGLELMPISSGTFLMGSTRLDPAHNGDEFQHEVVLTRDFWLGKHEVTRAEWSAVMGAPAPKVEDANLPMTQISWQDAMEFCRKLNERESSAKRLPAGYEYTLPTEAQWEYACRAGNTGLYGGVGGLAELGWYQVNSGGRIHPVGLKRANAWGLHDMHGNVWEWCSDWFEFYPRDKVVDPTGPASGPGRVLRGGGSSSMASSCRAASRLHSPSMESTTNLGFRLALSHTVSPR